MSIDTPTNVDRHQSLVEAESSMIATFQAGITAISPGITVMSPIAPLTLHPSPKRQSYTYHPPKPRDFINKSLKFQKTVLRLRKPRVSQRALVSSFDDWVGKQSRSPIPLSCPADVLDFLGRPHMPTAYTPPWMMRGFTPRYLLPPDPPSY